MPSFGAADPIGVRYLSRRGGRQGCLLALALLAAAAPQAPCAPRDLAVQGLGLEPGDLRIEARDDGGYDLFVRRKGGIASVLLTESTKDPAMKADNFAYRSPEFNEVNGREKRMLNGKALPPSSRLYSLISSTALPDPVLDSAFHILIPRVLVYGYTWSRSGTVAVGKGTFINIRAFAKPFADYAGAFADNPYEISLMARPQPPRFPVPPPPGPEPQPPEPPAPAREEPQKEAPPPPADDRTSAKIGAAIEAKPGQTLDLVVCLDTTESMVPYIDDIKKNLGPIIRERVAGFKSFRVGLVLYKDYWPDDYITRKYPFTADVAAFERSLRSITVFGGKDIPEAEIEALYAAATEFDWAADRRQVIVVTDAAPHPDPHGKILFEDVAREAGTRHIDMDSIIEPKLFPPPNPGHPDFENEAKRLSSLGSGGARPRILILGEGAAARDRGLLASELLAPLSASIGLAVIESEGAPLAAGGVPSSDAAALGLATSSGATQLLILKTTATGGLSETVSRLLDPASGKELARDVIWRSASEGQETAFVNGLRVK